MKDPKQILSLLEALQSHFHITGEGPQLKNAGDSATFWSIEWDGLYLHPSKHITATIAGDCEVDGWGIDVVHLIPSSMWEPEDVDIEEDAYTCERAGEAVEELVSMVLRREVEYFLERWEREDLPPAL